MNMACSNSKRMLDWSTVDTVLLDMDGTLLDRHFDDYFWEQFVPEKYAEKNYLAFTEARKQLLAKYKSRQGTLDWTDLDFWSQELELDIPALKIKVDHLIAVHPYVVDFLSFCAYKNKKTYLVTNAHSKTLDIKLEKTAISGYFARIVCSQEIGVAKEDPLFWRKLEIMLDFDKKRTLLADDTEAVLRTAKDFGIAFLFFVARPSSRLPTQYSADFPSIDYFNELFQGDC